MKSLSDVDPGAAAVSPSNDSSTSSGVHSQEDSTDSGLTDSLGSSSFRSEDPKTRAVFEVMEGSKNSEAVADNGKKCSDVQSAIIREMCNVAWKVLEKSKLDTNEMI